MRSPWGPAGILWLPAPRSLSRSSREALVWLGRPGCQGGAQLGSWHGPLAALPVRAAFATVATSLLFSVALSPQLLF